MPCRPARSWFCTPAAIIRPASISKLDDWKQVLDVLKAKGHVPFLDIAYQGFGNGIEEDAAAVRLFAQSGLSFFVSRLVLQILLALWRTRRRPLDRNRKPR